VKGREVKGREVKGREVKGRWQHKEHVRLDSHVKCLILENNNNMITPVFRLSQDDKHIDIHVQTPHAKLSDSELIVEASEVKLFASPYFLR